MSIENVVEETAFNLLKRSAIHLPEDVKKALRRAHREETSEMGKTQLEGILENIKIAERKGVPICQDTGTILFYIKVGREIKNLGDITGAVTRATREATEDIPLRPNAVNPFTQENSGDNTGRLIPWINWKVVSGDELEITVFPKGGGAENTCVMDMLLPEEGIKGVKRFVVEAVVKAGSKPCPPNILGVGIGGGADIAMKLAKKALLRPLDSKHPNPKIAKIEKEILKAVNMTGIGPMGLGGKTTALGVNINYAYRHPASYPVAVAFNCWAARRASAKISSEGTVEYLS